MERIKKFGIKDIIYEVLSLIQDDTKGGFNLIMVDQMERDYFEKFRCK